MPAAAARQRIQPQSIRAAGDAVVVTYSRCRSAFAAETALRTLISQVNTSGFGTEINDIDVASTDNQVRSDPDRGGLQLPSRRCSPAEPRNHPSAHCRRCRAFHPACGFDRIVVQLPGLQDSGTVRQLLGSTAKMSFHMVADANPNDPPPPGVTIMPIL